MKGIILFSMGLIMLLLALSCDAAPRWNRRPQSNHGHPPNHGHPQNHGIGGMSAWSSWSVCTRSCGGGTKTRRRTCIRSWRGCFRPLSETQRCNEVECCPQISDCEEQGVRIRKEFTSMTFPERERYINAVKTASTHECFKKKYEYFLLEHRTLFDTDIHQKIHFLTWHRWFVLQYENLLRRVDCGITIPFWDWSSDNPFDTSPEGVWSNLDSGFGGNGTGESSCVQTGPFREDEWSLKPPQIDPNITNKNCLARNFNTTPNAEEVQEVLDIPAANFTDFELGLRVTLHNTVHIGVGGTMATKNSAAAPEFFLHHAFVDKLWDDWQKKGEEYKYAFFPTVDEPMPCTDLMPTEVIDLSSLPGGVQVQYQSNFVNHRRGQRLSKEPRTPHGLDPKIIKLFNISPEEVKKVNKKERVVQPRHDDYYY